tara:strand:- start:490 stop:804 length:315 start_codon:yes stop_codon:yes gene_type:complete
MNHLKITTTNKAEAIKQINKFRLSNKNEWYVVEVSPKNTTQKDVISFLENPKNEIKYIYHFKIFDTYIQIARKYHKSKGLIFTDKSGMDLKVSEFKKYLNEIIE